MQPVLIANPTQMTLPKVGPVTVPVGTPVAQLSCSEVGLSA